MLCVVCVRGDNIARGRQPSPQPMLGIGVQPDGYMSVLQAEEGVFFVCVMGDSESEGVL